jgi:hypothetical protein
MGCSQGKDTLAYTTGDDAVSELQGDFKRVQIPLALKVAHYTPSSFPMVPVINKYTCKHLADSWGIIVKNDVEDQFGNSTSGITAFYSK